MSRPEMNIEDRKTVQEALWKYGSDAQIYKTIEELNELGAELSRELNNQSEKYDIEDEIADVYIMLESMAIIFNEEAIEESINTKTNRLEDIIHE